MSPFFLRGEASLELSCLHPCWHRSVGRTYKACCRQSCANCASSGLVPPIPSPPAHALFPPWLGCGQRLGLRPHSGGAALGFLVHPILMLALLPPLPLGEVAGADRGKP